jgi:peptide/nickel transport system permease protein
MVVDPSVLGDVRPDPSVAPGDPPMRLSRAMLSSTEGRIGISLLCPILLLVAIGPFLAPYPPTKLLVGPIASGPSSAHWLGTDIYGSDVLSRVLAGGHSVLLIPTAAIAIAAAVGGTLGLIGGYARGRLDVVISRIFDAALTLPPLLVVLVVIAGFGSATRTLIVAVGVVFAPGFGRVVRASTQSVVVHAYIEAARARGERSSAILLREVLPNIAAPVLAEFGLELTYGILFVSGVSYLGLGVQPPQADWGLMISQNSGLLAVAPLGALAPAVAITVLCVGLNLLTDSLSNYLSRGESSRVIEL